MKIALDYGGVIDFLPGNWATVVERLVEIGHHVFILSHAQPGEDAEKRQEFADETGAINISFIDIHSSDELRIQDRKADLVKQHEIDIFVDDYMERCLAVQRENHSCVCLYIPQESWQTGLWFFEGLTHFSLTRWEQ